MAFEKVSNPNRYMKYRDLNPGDVMAEGVFLGLIDGKYGHQYEVREEGGVSAIVPKCGLLDHYYRKGKFREGDYVKIVFKGTETLAKGDFAGRDSNQVDVYVDAERRNEDMSSSEEEDEAAEHEAVQAVKTVAVAKKAPVRDEPVVISKKSAAKKPVVKKAPVVVMHEEEEEEEEEVVVVAPKVKAKPATTVKRKPAKTLVKVEVEADDEEDDVEL